MNQAGYYLGKILNAYTGQLGANDTDFLVVENEITHMGVDGQWQPLDEPFTRQVKFCLKDGTPYEISERQLFEMKFNCDFDNPAFPAEYSTDGIVLVCTHEMYKGKQVENWNYQIGNDKPSIKETPRDRKAALSARMKANMQSQAKPPVGTVASPEQKATSTGNDLTPKQGGNDAPAPIFNNAGNVNGMDEANLPF